MVDLRKLTGEEGTTLAELLVVMVLLAVVGTVTTVGIVSSFRTQVTATRGAESLDELRLSVQRMRDDIRGADEVCASSDNDTLTIWTDRHDAGILGEDEDVEVVIFEVNPTTNQLTRRVRNSGTSTLISDVIVTPGGDVFQYDLPPTEQEGDLVCDTALLTAPSNAVTTSVDLDIDVQNEDGVNTVATTTTMRLRNAGLADITSGGGAGSSNDPPTASVNLPAQCVVGDPCTLDGVGADPESGVLVFEWDLDNDGAFDDESVEDPSPTFTAAGMVPVALRVTDDGGLSATATGTIEVLAAGSNLAPVAAFTYTCTGGTCMFDADDSAYANTSESGATESTDAEDPQSALVYEWTFQPSSGTAFTRTGSDQTESFATASVDVTLRVTDTAGAFDTSSVSISTAATTIRVASLKTVGSNPGGGTSTFTVTLTVRVTTTSGVTRNDVQVSADFTNANVSTGTCTTGETAAGACTIVVVAPQNNTVTVTIDTLSDASGAPYAPGQNLADTITAKKNTTRNEPS